MKADCNPFPGEFQVDILPVIHSTVKKMKSEYSHKRLK